MPSHGCVVFLPLVEGHGIHSYWLLGVLLLALAGLAYTLLWVCSFSFEGCGCSTSGWLVDMCRHRGLAVFQPLWSLLATQAGCGWLVPFHPPALTWGSPLLCRGCGGLFMVDLVVCSALPSPSCLPTEGIVTLWPGCANCLSLLLTGPACLLIFPWVWGVGSICGQME